MTSDALTITSENVYMALCFFVYEDVFHLLLQLICFGLTSFHLGLIHHVVCGQTEDCWVVMSKEYNKKTHLNLADCATL